MIFCGLTCDLIFKFSVFPMLKGGQTLLSNNKKDDSHEKRD